MYKSIRRAFASFDSHDNGFINVSDLDKLLEATSKLGANSEDREDKDPVASFVQALNTPSQRAKLRSAADPDNGMFFFFFLKIIITIIQSHKHRIRVSSCGKTFGQVAIELLQSLREVAPLLLLPRPHPRHPLILRV